jgi:hypothetical protein
VTAMSGSAPGALEWRLIAQMYAPRTIPPHAIRITKAGVCGRNVMAVPAAAEVPSQVTTTTASVRRPCLVMAASGHRQPAAMRPGRSRHGA